VAKISMLIVTGLLIIVCLAPLATRTAFILVPSLLANSALADATP